MPPVGNVTCLPTSMTSDGPRNFGKDDLDALLYIVVTLLFYSMGIIIGIITYLKREQAEMEEDKMFDTYMQLRREPLNLQKKERVQKMALYLKQMEEQKADKEKLEKKASESKQPQPKVQQHRKSLTKCTFQESPCQDGKAVPLLSNIRSCIAEAGTLTVLNSQEGENKEGTFEAFSAPPSVSEPLLTPDSKKRVAFPARSVFNATTVSVPSSPRFGTLLWQFPAYKSAFKHNPNFVHRPQDSLSEPRDVSAGKSVKKETRSPYLKVISPAYVMGCTENVLEQSNDESMKLRQFSGCTRAVCPESCPPDGGSRNDSERSPCNTATTPFSLQPGQHVASLSFPQPRVQTDKQTSCLAIHAHYAHNHQCLNLEETPNLNNSDRNLQLAVCNLENSPEREEAIARPIQCNKFTENLKHHKHFNQMQQLENCQSQTQQNIRTIAPKTFSGETVSSPSPQDECSQQQSQPIQLPAVLRYQVKPHTFHGTHILRLLTDDGSENTSLSSSDNPLPDDKSSPQGQQQRPCRKSRSQNFHLTGVTGTRQLGLEWRNKTNEKRYLPRSQPERRGALFFTQRSLQKDPDSPKTVGHIKQSRLPNVFSREESLHPGHSNSSDKSETEDSLTDRPTQFFCTSTSGVSTPVSPATTGSEHKINPHLATTQTIDSFTYL